MSDPCLREGVVVRFRYAAVLLIACTVFAQAQSNKPKPPRSSDRIVSQEIVISGTSTLSTEQLYEISSKLTAVSMRDDDQEVEERIKYQFQQVGYFDAEVTNVKVTPLDPLAKKKPVRIEAEVSEGPLFHLAELKFSGNTAYSADELRKMFPIRHGDVFDAEKIRLGLQTMRERYLTQGYLEFAPVPNTEKSGSSQMTVTFDLDEGIQYRMGQLKIEGSAHPAQQLQANWEIKPGEPYDFGYLAKFLAHNRELLPDEFNEDRDLQWLRDCSDDTINVTIELDSKRPWKPTPQDKPCQSKRDKDALKE